MKHPIFLMLFMSLFLWNCGQEELMVEHGEIQKVYTVCLNFNGDIRTEESSLSRVETESRDLYGIQIYKDGNNFAAGLFDNIDGVFVNLLAGGSYKFVCTLVMDGKDILYHSKNLGPACYSITLPFNYGNSSTDLNSFYYSDDNMDALNSSYVTLPPPPSGGDAPYKARCAEIDRFYGEVDNYTPSVNGIVSLELKRVSFGIKVKVSNITDGDVSVKCYNGYNTFIDVSELTSNYESEGALFSMANVYDAWQYSSNYLENITMSVTWNRGVGVTQSWTKTVQIKRNVMNTIRIKLGADDNDIGVGVTPEGGEMENEDEEIPLG